MSKSLQKTLRLFWQSLELTPVIVPVIIAVFGAVTIFFLLLNNFNPWLIWPIGLVLSAIAGYFVTKHYPKDVKQTKARKACNLLLIIGVLVWGSFNIFYTSQHVMTNRDPALYANGGIWLIDHNNLNIPKANIFGDAKGVYNDGGAGFGSPDNRGKIYQVQGAHLLDSFIGLTGRIVGLSKALHINVLFGMSALLAIYAFGRALIKRPWWAVVGTSVVAVSMPMIYFSRDSYSEPLAATFTFGGLAMIWLALKSKRLSLWFIAGLVMAAGAMTRIDAYLTLAGLAAFLGVFLASSAKKERPIDIKQVISFVVGALVTGLLGWLDIARLSQNYYHALNDRFILQMLGLIFVTICALTIVWLSWKTNIFKKLNKLTIKWRSIAGASGIIIISLLLAARPFILYGHYANGPRGNRSFAEISTQWVGWYIGGTMAVLGVIGLAIVAYKILEKRRPFITASFFVIAGTAIVYLVKPSIFPDQIWASRRLLPVILPGIAIFGAYAIDWISDRYLKKIQWGYLFAALASGALVLSPLLTSIPVLALRPYAQLDTMNRLCANLPNDSAILWLGTARITLIQPTRGVCKVPAEGYGPISVTDPDFVKPTRGELAKVSQNALKNNKTAIVGVFDKQVDILPSEVDKTNLINVATYNYDDLERTHTNPPQKTITKTGSIMLAKILPNGQLEPLNK